MTTVHYQGTLSDITQRDALIRELSVCAKSVDWGAIEVNDDGLVVTDESGYWNHGDEALLIAYFARLDCLAKNLCNHLANDVAPSPDADPDNLIACITRAAEMTHRQDNETFQLK